jgi:hypothetical protein
LNSCVLPSDELLFRKISLLERTSEKYHQLLIDYYQTLLDFDTAKSIDDKYKLVLEKMKTLWVKSDKENGLFDTAEKFEDVLKQIRGQDYRDHFIHSFNVFLLGYYIINQTKMTQTESKSNDVNLSWMLTATFHDVAYVIQDIDSWLNQLLEDFLGINPRITIDVPKILPMTYFDFMRVLSGWHKAHDRGALKYYDLGSIDWIFLNEMNSILNQRKDHGVMGALMLVHLLAIRNGFLQREGPYGNFLYNHVCACHAICVHGMTNIKISFGKHPLAFLLVLCDELQDWGRPRASGNLEQEAITLLDIEATRPTTDGAFRITAKVDGSLLKQQNLVEVLIKRLEIDDSVKLVVKNSEDTIIFPRINVRN